MSLETAYDFTLGICTGFVISAIWVLSVASSMAEDCTHPFCPHHKSLDKRTK